MWEMSGTVESLVGFIDATFGQLCTQMQMKALSLSHTHADTHTCTENTPDLCHCINAGFVFSHIGHFHLKAACGSIVVVQYLLPVDCHYDPLWAQNTLAVVQTSYCVSSEKRL